MSKYSIHKYTTKTRIIQEKYLIEADSEADAIKKVNVFDEDTLYSREYGALDIKVQHFPLKVSDDAFISEDFEGNRRLNIPESIEERSEE